jgi:cytidine deaminase
MPNSHTIQSCVLNGFLNIVKKFPKYIYDLINFMIIKRQFQMASNCHELKKSNHMCAILDVNHNPLIFGYNYYNVKNDRTVHAEVDAFNKLVNKLGRIRRKITIDIIIVRTNGGNSFPCHQCQKKMFDMCNKFTIRNIYYTSNDYDIDVIKYSKIQKN